MSRQGYVIDSAARTVRPVTFNGLAELQALVGGAIDIAYLWPNGDTLYVDDEGLLKDQEHFFCIAAERPDQPFAGNGVLVGREIDDTDVTAPPTMSLQLLQAKVQFFHRDQLLRAGN